MPTNPTPEAHCGCIGQHGDRSCETGRDENEDHINRSACRWPAVAQGIERIQEELIKHPYAAYASGLKWALKQMGVSEKEPRT